MMFVRDVAQVRDGYNIQRNIVRSNGRRSVLLTVLKNGGASTLAVINGIKDAIPGVKAQIPLEVKIETLFDQSVFVRESIKGVVLEGGIAACLTALMILIFLGSWRSTLIVAISILLSILVSLIVLAALGQTINIMTLGGLALTVVIPVDDTTVEIENIHRDLGLGKPIRKAILDGAQEIAQPAFVATISICIVFLPVLSADSASAAGYSGSSLSRTGSQAQLLRNFATISRADSIANINHYDANPTYDINAGVEGRDLGSVAAAVSKATEKTKLPRGSKIVIRGQAESMNSSFLGLGIGLIFAIVTRENKVRLNPVVVSRDYGQSIEITAGISADDRIVLDPTDATKDGAEVKPTAPKPEQGQQNKSSGGGGGGQTGQNKSKGLPPNLGQFYGGGLDPKPAGAGKAPGN